MAILAENKKVIHNYQILEKYEAGLVLSGPGVKSVKKGQINLKGSYITISPNQEAWLINAHIAPYPPAKREQKDYNPLRKRKILLHKKEIISLLGKSKQKGLTILPLKVYTKHGFVKIEIGLAKGKKKYDKRELIKKRETERKIRRALRGKV